MQVLPSFLFFNSLDTGELTMELDTRMLTLDV